MGGRRHGKGGEDVVIKVPVGTQVWKDESSPELLADLVDPGQRVCVARGGRGGRGNSRFASSTNRFPMLAEEGEPGEEISVRLDLKLLADVGIIGAPNAGKSSLLAAVSAATPKIADYPFTTLEPVLGVVERRGRSFVMADIPGLIEGAHQGAGLGHDFLRHVDRTRVLVHVVDGFAEDHLEAYRRVNEELRLYSERLLGKPQIIALSKMDIPEVRELITSTEPGLSEEDTPLCLISAASGEGLDALLDEVLQLLDAASEGHEATSARPEESPLPVIRPRARREPVKVRRQKGAYVVAMPQAARIAAMIDENNWNARIQFHQHLKRMGVIRALEEAGIGPGDTVRIGKVEWEWE